MPALFVLITLVLIGGVILVATQHSSIKKLNKLNAAQQRELASVKRQREQELQQLTDYTLQNPLDAYKLLVEHVSARSKHK